MNRSLIASLQRSHPQDPWLLEHGHLRMYRDDAEDLALTLECQSFALTMREQIRSASVFEAQTLPMKSSA